MKNFAFAIFLFLSTFSPCFGQSAKPTATPPPGDGDDVVKISTALIQLDVTVTDKSGKIVTDLNPEDFEIYENDEKRSITNFSFVSSASATLAEEPAGRLKPDRNSVPPVPLRPEQVRRTIALVVDDFSLNRDSVVQVRRALRKFVDEQMRDGDLVAVVRLSRGNSTIQQFTSDRNFLRAAIEQINWYYLSLGGNDAFAPLAATPLERAKSLGVEVSEEQLEDEKNSAQAMSAFQSKVFSRGTLGSLNYVIGGMKDLPGRKSVMLFSDGFKLILQDRGFTDTTSVKEAIQRVADIANRSSVVIYTMDARGLQPTALGAQDSVADGASRRAPTLTADRSRELFDTQDGLIELAEQTGGVPIRNTSDLNAGIGRMLEDQKGYYLLAYVPDEETFDPKNLRFNKLTVKVKRPGLNVRYRNGFFGIEDVKAPVGRQTPAQQIAEVLNSPFAAKGIDLRLNALFANDAQTGSFVNSLLYINAKGLQFTNEPDGSHKASFDLLAVSFGENNAVTDQFSKNYTVNLKGEAYQKALREGILYNFVFPIKKAGFYQLRVGLRDAASRKVGTANQFIEVPDLKARRLTLSGIVLENLSLWEFQNLPQGAPGGGSASQMAGTTQLDTSLRRFKQGTVLRYGYEIYNAKAEPSQKPRLTAQTRIFRDGQLLFEGKRTAVETTGQSPQKVTASGALSLGSVMTPGDYVLQVVVTDELSKEKNKVATQYVQFEIVP